MHSADITIFCGPHSGGVGRDLPAKHDWFTGGSGWRHTLGTAGEGEFFVIDWRAADRQLERGLAAFAGLGCSPAGFEAPTRVTLAGAPLPRRTLRMRLLHLACGRELPTTGPTLSVRSALRRSTLQLRLRRLRARLGRAPRVRLEAHPGDVLHPSVRAFWLNMIAALHQTHRLVGERTLWAPPT